MTEMGVIVASILLAFAIQAWWEQQQERRELSGIEALLTAQMSANADVLRTEADDAEAAQAALGEAVRAINPDPEQISADSLWSLLRDGWGMSDRELEVSALEALLDMDSFEPAGRPTLYRQMVAFRGAADRIGRNVERFVDVKMRTSDYLMSVSPRPTLMFDDPDPEGGFPVPIEDLLRDQALEGFLRELYQRQVLRETWAQELLALSDSISERLEAGS